jgi:hypothetical protein
VISLEVYVVLYRDRHVVIESLPEEYLPITFDPNLIRVRGIVILYQMDEVLAVEYLLSMYVMHRARLVVCPYRYLSDIHLTPL